MLSTYKALLNNNCLQWLDEIPPHLNHLTVTVHVTVLDELSVKKSEPKVVNVVKKKDPLLGLFADDADLLDQITESAMQARNNHPLRHFDE